MGVCSEQLLETNQRVRELTLQLTSLEDQLSAARLEASKLRTEATTERSSWEIRVHDLQTKINEVRVSGWSHRGGGGGVDAVWFAGVHHVGEDVWLVTAALHCSCLWWSQFVNDLFNAAAI